MSTGDSAQRLNCLADPKFDFGYKLFADTEAEYSAALEALHQAGERVL